MTQDITEETLNSLVKETFRFEPAQDQSLSLLDLMRRRRQVGTSLLRPVQFTRPKRLPRVAPEVQLETPDLEAMEF